MGSLYFYHLQNKHEFKIYGGTMDLTKVISILN